jgi:hypothetical protein
MIFQKGFIFGMIMLATNSFLIGILMLSLYFFPAITPSVSGYARSIYNILVLILFFLAGKSTVRETNFVWDGLLAGLFTSVIFSIAAAFIDSVLLSLLAELWRNAALKFCGTDPIFYGSKIYVCDKGMFFNPFSFQNMLVSFLFAVIIWGWLLGLFGGLTELANKANPARFFRRP